MPDSANYELVPLRETLELVRQAAAGNVNAWQILDDGHRAALATLVRRRLPPKFRRRFDTEDIVQSALFDAFRGLEDFDDHGEKSFRSWLSRIVLNKLYQRQRFHCRDRRNVERDGSVEETGFLQFINDKTTDEELREIADQHAFVIEQIENLPVEERDAVTLHLIEGLSHAEVAEELGMGTRTARKHCSNGVARLLKWTTSSGRN